MTKRILVFSPQPIHSYALPSLLLNFQRHHEQFGRHPNEWEWCDPIVDFKDATIDDFADRVLGSTDPDIIAIGMYIWNEELCLELAKRAKLRNPNCIVVAGGPQIGFLRDNTWFKVHHYVDYGCQVSGYGENFMTELLDQIIEGNIVEENIPLLCKPTDDELGYKQVGPSPNPREYVWPKKIFDPEDPRIERWIKEAKSRNEPVVALLEGARGCPYFCTYCEWGGGIGTKINAKPTDQLIEEIELLVRLGVDKLFLTDANWGILKRDVDVTRRMVELKHEMGRHYEVLIAGPAKNNDDRVNEIYDMLLTERMNSDYTLNIQTFDHELLKNIKRTDTPWETRIGPYLENADKFNLEVKVHLIYPLPGWSYQHFLNEIDIQAKYELWGILRFELQVLPNTEMADPENIEKFGLQLKTIRPHALDQLDVDTTNMENQIFFDPDRVEVDNDHRTNDLRYNYLGTTRAVVASNAITSKQLVDAKWLIDVSLSFQNLGIFVELTDWLASNNVPHSEYYDRFVNDWLWRESNSVNKKTKFQLLWNMMKADLCDDPDLAIQRQRYPLDDFPFLLDPQHMLIYGWTTEQEILDDWSSWVEDTWGKQAGDLAKLIVARTITIDWDPVDGRVYTSKWDWRPWINDRQDPIVGSTTLQWKQTHFRGKLLPVFKQGDRQTGKLWIFGNMFPINRTQRIKRNNFTYVTTECEEVLDDQTVNAIKLTSVS